MDTYLEWTTLKWVIYQGAHHWNKVISLLLETTNCLFIALHSTISVSVCQLVSLCRTCLGNYNGDVSGMQLPCHVQKVLPSIPGPLILRIFHPSSMIFPETQVTGLYCACVYLDGSSVICSLYCDQLWSSNVYHTIKISGVDLQPCYQYGMLEQSLSHVGELGPGVQSSKKHDGHES